LELGYFVGRLGFARLRRGDVEIPSDFDGVVYETYLIGKCPIPPPIPDNPPLLTIDMKSANMDDGQRFVAVNMRLFADLGQETPAYVVVAGVFTD
jgi:hypothetical protein